jgi:toxin-antitoxin system PIN domain toxin
MQYLMDVNMLLAAIWINHPDHQKANAWLPGKTIVTCPLSELGFLRISTNPKALKSDMATARQLLKAFLQKQKAQFVAADLPALKSNAIRSEHVTDHYLADLASNRRMKLATLDSGISHSAAELVS